MKKIFSLLFIFALLLCSCQGKEPDVPNVERPMLFYSETYWVNPYMPISELPEGYEYAGTIDSEMAYNTGLEGIEYYTNPENNDFYTYQETGTPVGGNTVDTEKQAMHYIQWIPVD